MKEQPILAIGAALMDVIAPVNDDMIEALDIDRGGMRLVDAETSRRIHDCITPTAVVAGGSCANTAAIVSALAQPAWFLGNVGQDPLGRSFIKGMQDAGVCTHVGIDQEIITGNCLSLISADGQRSMSTCLGAASTVSARSIDTTLLERAGTILVEGYLLDWLEGAAIFERVAIYATGRIAFSLSDSACVDRHRTRIMGNLWVMNTVFGNGEEMISLTQRPDLQSALADLHDLAAYNKTTFVCTDGPHGAWIVDADGINHAPAAPAIAVDTTGAGDSYAGTILAALNAGHSLATSARMAAIVAAEVVSSIGARPQRDLLKLLQDAGIPMYPEKDPSAAPSGQQENTLA